MLFNAIFGLRLKEACLLEWKDIVYDKDLVKVYPHKTKHKKPNPTFVPLNNNLKTYLKNLIK